MAQLSEDALAGYCSYLFGVQLLCGVFKIGSEIEVALKRCLVAFFIIFPILCLLLTLHIDNDINFVAVG